MAIFAFLQKTCIIICKMLTIRKSIVDPIALGAELRDRRKRLFYTLQDFSKIALIDVGQLSRFERGDMKRMSQNLQKYIANLQIHESATVPAQVPDVVRRFAVIVQRSERHAAAASAFVNVLEGLL
jgi:transcriptional regulator with XRE-family HTH domain